MLQTVTLRLLYGTLAYFTDARVRNVSCSLVFSWSCRSQPELVRTALPPRAGCESINYSCVRGTVFATVRG